MSSETARLQMPLLQAAQAQKHVTVNEALMRLDGISNLVLQSLDLALPPVVVTDGRCYGVPIGAIDTWAGQAGKIAVGSNGGWVFVTPSAGMRAFVVDRGVVAVHDGAEWVPGVLSLGALGSGLLTGMVEAEVEVGTGASFDTGVTIPSHVMVIGAVARVVEPLGGSLDSWKLGTAGAFDRFGQGLGKGDGSWARGLLGQPMTYYDAANLLMTAEGGVFGGGRVRLAVHYLSLRLPGEG